MPALPCREVFFARRLSVQKTDFTLFRRLRPAELCEAKRKESANRRSPSSRLWDYSTTVWQKRIKIVAIWARVALPWGRRVSSSKPWRRPSATAQERAWVA